MSSPPNKLLRNESRTSPSAAGFIGTIEGHLLINGAVIQLSSSSSRSRTVHDLGPRRASEHFRAGPWPLQVVNCCALWQTLAAAPRRVFSCRLDVFR